ncbi:hypothetical protein ACJMK2_005137 [Sinanodonta woodiana]|uniref:BRISC complex subunit Abro1 n=1 Tax=Sinanodonta woodiana TaxID=1069815 RepID=A0ABD3VSK7_SINWO
MAGYVSGAVLASLFYDHANSRGDQMGFLLGEVVSHVKDTISDSQIQNSEVETRIYIYASVPFKYDQKFYGRDGQVNVDQIKNVLGGRYQDILGWYSFRRNSSMLISLRERTLHSSLLETLITTHLDNFLFLLCTVWVTEDHSTHSWDHSFYRLGPRGFQTVPVEVTNLGDTTHTEYKQRSSHMICPKQSAMQSVFQAQEQLFLNSAGRVDVDKIQTLTETVHSKLKVLAKAVGDSEHRLTELQNEVDQYREKIRQKSQSSEEEEKGQSRIQEAVKKKLSVDDLLSLDIVVNSPSVDQQVKETDKIKSEKHEKNPKILNSKSSKDKKTITTSHPLPHHEMRKTCNRQDVSENMEVDVDSSTSQSDERLNNSSHQTDEQRKEKNSDPFCFVSVMLDDQKGVTRSGDNAGHTKSTILLQKGQDKRMPQGKLDLLSDDTDKTLDGNNANPVLTYNEVQQPGSLKNTGTASTTSCIDSNQGIKAERSRSQRLRINQKMDTSRSRSHEKTDSSKAGLRFTSINKANSMTDISPNMEDKEYNTSVDVHYRGNVKSVKITAEIP